MLRLKKLVILIPYLCEGKKKKNKSFEMLHNGLRIREGYEAEPLALSSFLLYAVIGCPSFGINF